MLPVYSSSSRGLLPELVTGSGGMPPMRDASVLNPLSSLMTFWLSVSRWISSCVHFHVTSLLFAMAMLWLCYGYATANDMAAGMVISTKVFGNKMVMTFGKVSAASSKAT